MSDVSIGTQGSALFGDNLKATKKIGENLTDEQAVSLAQKNEGSELLIEKNDKGVKSYDVYQLSNEKTGKALTTKSLIEGDVHFNKNTAKEFGGESATIATDDERKSPFFAQIRKKDTFGDLAWSAKAIVLDGLSIITGGKAELQVNLGDIAENEQLQYIADDLSLKKENKK